MKRNVVENSRLPVFTERFRELQGEKSNTEFASFLGMSRQTVGFYLNGDRIPDALVLKDIAEKCGVSADWLLGLCDTPTNDYDVKKVCEFTGLTEQSVLALRSFIDMKKRSKAIFSYKGEIRSFHVTFVNKLFSSPMSLLNIENIIQKASLIYSANLEMDDYSEESDDSDSSSDNIPLQNDLNAIIGESQSILGKYMDINDLSINKEPLSKGRVFQIASDLFNSSLLNTQTNLNILDSLFENVQDGMVKIPSEDAVDWYKSKISSILAEIAEQAFDEQMELETSDLSLEE